MNNIIWVIFLSLVLPINLINARELIIISDPFPPWQFKATDGSVVGVNIDIMDSLAKKLNLKVSYKHEPWTRAWLSIKRGEGDAVMSASRKVSREPYIRYPALNNNLWTSRYVFFSNNNKAHLDGSYQSILDNNQSICIVNGFSYHKSFWQHFPYTSVNEGAILNAYAPDRRDYHPLIYPVVNQETCFKLLIKERVDVVISDLSVGLFEIKKLAKNNKFNIKNISHYDTTLFSKGYPLSFVKNSDYPDLANIADRFWEELLVMQSNGEYQKVVDKWLKH